MSETFNAPLVVMLSGDLMFGSRVKSAAEQAGFDFQIGGRMPEDDIDGVRFVVLDLSTCFKQVSEVVAVCHQRHPEAKVIAYGPHVQVDKLRGAREAGIDIVMTNGQFDSQLSTLFRS